MPTIDPATIKSNKFLAIDGDYRVVDGASAVADLLNYDPATGDVTYSAPTGSGSNTRTHRFARPMVSTSTIDATTFTGALVGNASTATTLATARTIWGQSFNGSAAISGAITGATTGAFSGAVSMAGLTATTGAFSGTLAVTGAVTLSSSGLALSFTGAGTGSQYLKFASTGGAGGVYLENSTGASIFTNSLAYSTVFGTENSTAVHLASAGVVRLTASTAGVISIANLAGVGTRTVVVDANGVLSAP